MIASIFFIPCWHYDGMPRFVNDPVVLVDGLEKSYALGTLRVDVLRGVSFAIEPEERVAIMGPSGSGKSTILNCIAGLTVPDRGRLEILGKDFARLDDEARTLERRRTMGIIYQFFNLVPNLDVKENVLLPYLIEGDPVIEADVEAALECVGMQHRASHLPAQLSGGEMQLVSIARAIVRRPKLILADEPTGNINVATGRKIMLLLKDAVKTSKSALLLVTHHPEDAAKMDRVLFLKDGVVDPMHELTGQGVTLASVHATLEKLEI
jgi:putative ABC transport system ATP-binding protein